MSYIISFFKIIFIWLGLAIATIIPGYIFNIMFKHLRIRMIAGLLFGVGLIILGFLNLISTNISYYILSTGYIISALLLIWKDKSIGEEYKKIKHVNSSIDSSWACLFGNIFNILLITCQAFKSIVPLEIKFFDIYLYVNYILFLCVPIYIVSDVFSRILRIHSNIVGKKIITVDEIFKEYSSMINDGDTEEEKNEQLDNLLEIIDYFEDNAKIIKIEPDSEEPFYIETKTYNNIKTEIEKILIEVRKISINEINRYIKMDFKLKPIEKEHIICNIISTYDNWFKFNNIFIEEGYLKEIEEYIKTNINEGKFSFFEAEQKYSISNLVLNQIIDYYQIEIIDKLNDTKNNLKHYNSDELTDIFIEKNQNKSDFFEENLIDINYASEEDFRNISVIGAVLAKKIIKYREYENGFKSVDDFFEFTKLSPHKIILIKDKIKCTPIEKSANRLRGRRVEF